MFPMSRVTICSAARGSAIAIEAMCSRIRSFPCSRVKYADLRLSWSAFWYRIEYVREDFMVPGAPLTRTTYPSGIPPFRTSSKPCTGQSKVQSYCNGDEDVGCGHKDKKRDDHPSSRPALLVEKRPRQTSLVIQRPHAETSILPYRQSPSGGESPDYGTPLAKKENQTHAVQHDGHQLGVFGEDVQ